MSGDILVALHGYESDATRSDFQRFAVHGRRSHAWGGIAALMAMGCRDPSRAGDIRAVQRQLRNARRIQASRLGDGFAVTWGEVHPEQRQQRRPVKGSDLDLRCRWR